MTFCTVVGRLATTLSTEVGRLAMIFCIVVDRLATTLYLKWVVGYDILYCSR